tara:strand:+ start:437 stop:1156 length:720 start_codon:yes stop_codon:yes gene_type:complete
MSEGEKLPSLSEELATLAATRRGHDARQEQAERDSLPNVLQEVWDREGPKLRKFAADGNDLLHFHFRLLRFTLFRPKVSDIVEALPPRLKEMHDAKHLVVTHSNTGETDGFTVDIKLTSVVAQKVETMKETKRFPRPDAEWEERQAKRVREWEEADAKEQAKVKALKDKDWHEKLNAKGVKWYQRISKPKVWQWLWPEDVVVPPVPPMNAPAQGAAPQEPENKDKEPGNAVVVKPEPVA